MADEDYINMVKERLVATCVLEKNADEFLRDIDNIYIENICKLLTAISTQIVSDASTLTSESTFEIVKDLNDTFLERKDVLLNNFELFASRAIFRVPKGVVLPQDEPFQEPVRNYSKEEDSRLDRRVEELFTSMHQKRTYFKLLNERIGTVSAVLNTLRQSNPVATHPTENGAESLKK